MDSVLKQSFRASIVKSTTSFRCSSCRISHRPVWREPRLNFSVFSQSAPVVVNMFGGILCLRIARFSSRSFLARFVTFGLRSQTGARKSERVNATTRKDHFIFKRQEICTKMSCVRIQLQARVRFQSRKCCCLLVHQAGCPGGNRRERRFRNRHDHFLFVVARST